MIHFLLTFNFLGALATKSEIKVKSTRKPLSKSKPQRSSSFKSQSKSTLKPVIGKSQYNNFLLMLRDAIDGDYPQQTQLDILRGAKEYIIHLQQLIHQDDEVSFFFNFKKIFFLEYDYLYYLFPIATNRSQQTRRSIILAALTTRNG